MPPSVVIWQVRPRGSGADRLVKEKSDQIESAAIFALPRQMHGLADVESCVASGVGDLYDEFVVAMDVHAATDMIAEIDEFENTRADGVGRVAVADCDPLRAN